LAFRDFSLSKTHFRPFTAVLQQIRRDITRKVDFIEAAHLLCTSASLPAQVADYPP
jgi:hypothetical protein